MFILQHDPIDLKRNSYVPINENYGAFVSFEGVVRADRNGNTEVASLLYLPDADNCIKEGQRIIEETHRLFDIKKAVCIQRVGQVAAGESATWIGVWSSHRDDAFKGCRHIIEETKKRLFIWKKEFFADGTSAWVRGANTPEIV